MKYTIRKSIIEVVGNIWQPGAPPCCMEYTLSDAQMKECRLQGLIFHPREVIANWLKHNAGDFQDILDFHASLEVEETTLEIPWESEDNEILFSEVMSV